VVSIGGTPVATWEDVADAVSRHPGEPVEVVVARGGEEKRFTVTPQRVAGNKGRVGISTMMKHEQPGVVAAVGLGLAQPVRVLADYVKGLWSFAFGNVEGELMGPVGLVRETQRVARNGAADLLWLVASFLSLVWPVSAIVAVGSVPRRARAARAPRPTATGSRR
jgi:regulator of sigma E protease